VKDNRNEGLHPLDPSCIVLQQTSERLKMNDKDTVEDLHQDFLEDISLKDAISALSRGALPAVVLMRYRNTVINEVIKTLQDDQK